MKMPSRLTEVGQLERKDHYHLPADARCYFWGEYTPFDHTNGLNWDYSSTNKIISNFKKKMDRKCYSDWHYKQEAIQEVALEFSKFWKWQQLYNCVALVPMPPSRSRTDAMFDPRMMDMLKCLSGNVGLQLDIRDCLSFSGRFEASHISGNRPTPEILLNELSFCSVAGRTSNIPEAIFLFDDVLTTGAHYCAATRKLSEYFPGVPVIGNFIARRCLT